VGCKIYEEKLPINEAARKAAFKFGLDPTICALNGG
jgi:thiamine-monophosphate kinase